MNYEIKVIDCEASGLELALNQPAAEGWQLVSCWPEGSAVRAVFQRQAGADSAPPKSRPVAQATPSEPVNEPSLSESSMPPDDKLLDAVIAACREQPPKTTQDGKPLPPGIGLAKLGKTWGPSADKIREKLQELGVKEKAGKTSKDHFHNGFYIWFYGDFVNIREAKRKSPAPR